MVTPLRPFICIPDGLFAMNVGTLIGAPVMSTLSPNPAPAYAGITASGDNDNVTAIAIGVSLNLLCIIFFIFAPHG
jgi:hypothetical protein